MRLYDITRAPIKLGAQTAKVPAHLAELPGRVFEESLRHANRLGRFMLGVVDKNVFLEDLQRNEPVDRARNFSRTLMRQTAVEAKKKEIFENEHPNEQYQPSSYLTFLALAVAGANKEVTRRYQAVQTRAKLGRFGLRDAHRQLEMAEEDIAAVTECIPAVIDVIPLLPASDNTHTETTAERIVAEATSPVDVMDRNVVSLPTPRQP